MFSLNTKCRLLVINHPVVVDISQVVNQLTGPSIAKNILEKENKTSLSDCRYSASS